MIKVIIAIYAFFVNKIDALGHAIDRFKRAELAAIGVDKDGNNFQVLALNKPKDDTNQQTTTAKLKGLDSEKFAYVQYAGTDTAGNLLMVVDKRMKSDILAQLGQTLKAYLESKLDDVKQIAELHLFTPLGVQMQAVLFNAAGEATTLQANLGNFRLTSLGVIAIKDNELLRRDEIGMWARLHDFGDIKVASMDRIYCDNDGQQSTTVRFQDGSKQDIKFEQNGNKVMAKVADIAICDDSQKLIAALETGDDNKGMQVLTGDDVVVAMAYSGKDGVPIVTWLNTLQAAQATSGEQKSDTGKPDGASELDFQKVPPFGDRAQPPAIPAT